MLWQLYFDGHFYSQHDPTIAASFDDILQVILNTLNAAYRKHARHPGWCILKHALKMRP